MAHALIEKMRSQLVSFQAGQLQLSAMSETFREDFSQVVDQLPPGFTTVLHDVLDRLEASSLFSEESCSFSQHDLIAHLQTWLDKAQARLEPVKPQA